MRIEYILLIVLFVLPIMYKLWLWGSIFESQSYDLKNFYQYIKTQPGKRYIYHFWILLEFPIFLLSFIPLFDSPFEILLYSFMFYFGVLYNIFVIWKILRKNFIVPIYHKIIFLVFLLILIEGIFTVLVYEKYLYTYLSWLLLFMPVYFIAVIWAQKVCNKYLKIINLLNKNIWKK